jgi:hypothetical protein
MEEEVDGKGSHTRSINQRAAKLVKLKHTTNTRSSDNFMDLTRPSLSGIREEPFGDSYDGYGIEFDFDGIDQGRYNRAHFQVDVTTDELEAEVDVEVEAEIVDNKVFRCCADCNIEKHPSSFTRKQRSLLSDAVCKACRKGRIQRTCFGCGLDLTKYQFSNDQKKKGAAARCMKCIKNCSMKQAEGKKNNKNKNKNNKPPAEQQQRRDCAKCGDRSNLFSKKQRKKGAAAICMNCTKYPPKKQEDRKEQRNNKNDLNELSQSLPSFSADRGLGRGMQMTRPAWMKEQQNQRPDHQHQQQVIESLRPGANNCDDTDDGLGRGCGAHMTRPAG